MDEAKSRATTLKELLVEIRNGFSIYAPVLIPVQPGSRGFDDETDERTVTVSAPLDWADQYTKEYANREFVIIGSNSLRHGLDTPVKIGRSRTCDLRVENDSVSKVHASIAFDRGSGSYFLCDENSRNGTCINSEPVPPGEKTALWSGVYVSFGDAVYVFIDPPTLRKLSRLATVE